MSNRGFDTYLTFHALKSHFSKEEYDYFTYHGILKNIDSESYQEVSEREKRLYEKFGNRYSMKRVLENFIVSNLLMTQQKIVVAHLNTYEAEQHFKKWSGRVEALSHNTLSDLKWMMQETKKDDPKQVLKHLLSFQKNEHPLILQMLMGNAITIETFLVMDLCIKFFSKFNTSLEFDPAWSKIRFRCDKYRPFLKRLDVDFHHLKKEVRKTLQTPL